MNEICPVTRTLDIIGGKWTLLILRDLFEGTKRFGELRKSLEGVSPKTLSERLQYLEKEGIIERRIYAEVPPKVEYSLTERGKTLRPILLSMKHWGKANNSDA